MPFQPRRLTDPRDMRALAHPIRLALMEALGEHGELTATEAAGHVGESPSSCSFHLRQLAKYGFVQEAGTAGAGRRRPWRLSGTGIEFHAPADADDETRLAVTALEQLMTDRYLSRAQRALDVRAALPAPWRAVTGVSQFVLHVTPQELAQLNDDIVEVLSRYVERFADPALRPEGTRAIEALAIAYPLT